MTTLELIKLFIEIAIISLGAYAIYSEKDLVRFERKAAKYIKAFFKALQLSIRDKKQSKRVAVVTPYRNDEYDEMLNSLNKASRLDDVLVA
jgi:uncharacterized protein (UPF0305 family)